MKFEIGDYVIIDTMNLSDTFHNYKNIRFGIITKLEKEALGMTYLVCNDQDQYWYTDGDMIKVKNPFIV